MICVVQYSSEHIHVMRNHIHECSHRLFQNGQLFSFIKQIMICLNLLAQFGFKKNHCHIFKVVFIKVFLVTRWCNISVELIFTLLESLKLDSEIIWVPLGSCDIVTLVEDWIEEVFIFYVRIGENYYFQSNQLKLTAFRLVLVPCTSIFKNFGKSLGWVNEAPLIVLAVLVLFSSSVYIWWLRQCLEPILVFLELLYLWCVPNKIKHLILRTLNSFAFFKIKKFNVHSSAHQLFIILVEQIFILTVNSWLDPSIIICKLKHSGLIINVLS